MRVPDPAPVAKGLAVAAASLAGIPAICRWIENHPALGLVAVVVLAARVSASRTSLPEESEVPRRSRLRNDPNRQRI
jgi:hypothetical protein